MQRESSTQHRPTSPLPAVQVREGPQGVGTFAVRPIAAGECVLIFDGIARTVPTRHSIQLGDRVHIEADRALDEAMMRVVFPWRYLNHACTPSTHVHAPTRSLRASRALAVGDEITFDYTTTEAELAEPFQCACGSSQCLGTVRGFLHLTDEQRRAREATVAPHLKSLLHARTGA